jgi:predicted dehydrogenase
VATHPAATVGYAVHFLRKNIPVMLEKPAGLSLDDALLLQKVANAHPVPLLVSHQHLFSSVYQELKKIVNEEEIMQIETAAGNDGPYRDYSFIWDYAPHDIAMILGLKQKEPKLINAVIQSSSEYGGQCEFAIAFDDGSTAITKIWNDRVPKKRQLQVKSRNNLLIYDDLNYKDALIINGEKFLVHYGQPLTLATMSFLKAVGIGKTDDYRFGSAWALNIADLIGKIKKRASI